MIPPTVFITPVLSITWFCLWGMGKIKNDKTQKMSYIPVIPLLPLLTFTTLPSVISAERLSSHSHSQKPEPPHCKEKVITSIHSWANCSNSAVSQQSTPASKQICIYHGCLPDRFSQASWNRENVFNGSIMLMTHFLQITFASSVYCLQRIWKTSHRNEDIFFFFFFLSTYSNKKETANPYKSNSDGEAWMKFCLFFLHPLYFPNFFLSYSITFLSPDFYSSPFFSYFGKNTSKGRKKEMHAYLTHIVPVIYEFWIWIEIKTDQQMVWKHEYSWILKSCITLSGIVQM